MLIVPLKTIPLLLSESLYRRKKTKIFQHHIVSA